MDLITQLKRDEGLRLHAYPDPLTHAEPWTIGYGHTGDVKKGDLITEHQAEQLLLLDIDKHKKELEKSLPWVCILDDARYGCLLNMAFNMGIPKLLKFKNTLKHVECARYNDASEGMLDSLWAKQVKDRAIRLAVQMRTGEWH